MSRSWWLSGLAPASLARGVLRVRQELHRLADALVPAPLVAAERALGVTQTMALAVVAKHGIADALADGPKSAQELAALTQVDADSLDRTLRALCTLGFFARLSDGRYRNTRLSEPLRSKAFGSMASFAQYIASASDLAAWASFEETVRTGKNGFERVHGTDVWSWFEAHPDERALFAGAMASLTELAAPSLAHAYPWKEVRRVCDVGGGRGQLLGAILQAHSHLAGVLCDGAEVLALARAHLAAIAVVERVHFEPGSFFDSVPSGCDAYLLKDILHDWDDPRCLQILHRCRGALTAGGRLLIAETIVEPDTTHGPGPWSDLHMMVVSCEGRQRSRAQLERLLREAHFRPGRLFETAALTSILEGIAE